MRTEILSIKDFSADAFGKMYRLMSLKRQQKADSYKNENDRLLCILSDYLSRKLISEETGIDAADVVIETDEMGKPFTDGIYFNYSHSGDMTAAIVCNSPAGIDIEKITERPMKAASRFATEKEKEYIGDSIENYLRIWTLKEAYFKCIGTGLRGDLKSVEFEVKDGRVDSSVAGFDLGTEMKDGYIISYCRKCEK